jgi:hypothetical protein
LSPGESLLKVRSQLTQNALDLFNEYNVQIMTPSFESNPKEPVLVPKDKWYPPPDERRPAEDRSRH